MEHAQDWIMQRIFLNPFELTLVSFSVSTARNASSNIQKICIGVPGRGMDRGTPKILVDNPGKKVKSEDIRQSYKKKIGLKCTKGCVLSEVITCYTRRADNKSGDQSKPVHCNRSFTVDIDD
jgi:hypothetical protein